MRVGRRENRSGSTSCPTSSPVTRAAASPIWWSSPSTSGTTNLYTEQVQDFTPTPMSLSTAMYHTGLDPFTLQPVHVPKGREKQVQRALLQYRDPENYGLVCEGLRSVGRDDLIGSGWTCLVGRNRQQHGIPARKKRRIERRLTNPTAGG